MDLSWLTLGALATIVVVSCTMRTNPGLLAIVLAWIIAVYTPGLDGQTLGIKELFAGFPSELFLTLTGVSLLFSSADANGTLARVARLAERLCRGNPGLIALGFCLFAWTLGSVGAGNIAVAALLAPLAMATAERAAIPPLLMTVMVAHGAIASTLSPLAHAGVVADKILADMGQGGNEWKVFAYNALANLGVALAGFVLFGGLKLLRTNRPIDDETRAVAETSKDDDNHRFALRHRLTLVAIGGVVLAVIFAQAQVGMASFAAAVGLLLMGAVDERESLRRIPWGVILMVCGVSVLTSLLDKTGGTTRFAQLVDTISTPGTITLVLAFLTGVVSIYSSTTGVVLPTFLPMVAELAKVQPSANALSLALSVIIGGNLVDVSPLSTIGALCIAAAGANVDRRRLFNQLMAWGFSMAIVGALICWLLL